MKFFATPDDTISAAFPECLTVSAMADNDAQIGALGAGTQYGGDDQIASFSNHSIGAAAAPQRVRALRYNQTVIGG